MCFPVYLDSCEDREHSLLLTVFLWHTVLNTQLVIPHTVNGILNYTFISVVLACLLFEETECSLKHQGLQRGWNCFIYKTQAHRYNVSLHILP